MHAITSERQSLPVQNTNATSLPQVRVSHHKGLSVSARGNVQHGGPVEKISVRGKGADLVRHTRYTWKSPVGRCISKWALAEVGTAEHLRQGNPTENK